jgi:hypothetical protein
MESVCYKVLVSNVDFKKNTPNAFRQCSVKPAVKILTIQSCAKINVHLVVNAKMALFVIIIRNVLRSVNAKLQNEIHTIKVAKENHSNKGQETTSVVEEVFETTEVEEC